MPTFLVLNRLKKKITSYNITRLEGGGKPSPAKINKFVGVDAHIDPFNLCAHYIGIS